jgi:hypothetical protein
MTPEFERLIGHAVLDTEFREQVLNDPEQAAKAGGFNLDDTELEELKDLVRRYQKHADSGSFDALGGRLGAW